MLYANNMWLLLTDPSGTQTVALPPEEIAQLDGCS